MKITWYPPLDRFFGPMSEMALSGPISLSQLLRRLTEQEAGLSVYARFGSGDSKPQGLLVFRDGKILNLNDSLKPEDELEMLILVTGG